MFEVVSCAPLTKSVSRIFLKSPHAFPYQAGQYLQIVHPDGTRSPLSIANAPHHDTLELHLAHPKNNASACKLLALIESEKKLTVEGPFGNCTTQKLIQQQPLIFLARGTGFSPVKAIMEDVVHQQKTSSLHLFWSVSRVEDFYLLDVLDLWVNTLPNFSFTPVLARGEKKLQHAVLNQYPQLDSVKIYVSAPPALVYEIGNDLSQHGLQEENYFSDVFDYEEMTHVSDTQNAPVLESQSA